MISLWETVTFSCTQHNQGIVGNAAPHCQADRQLSSIPHCDYLNCSVPAIANATSNASVLQAEESTEYACNVGYFLRGNATAICNGNNGSLSFMQEPTCHYFNCLVPGIPNGRPSASELNANESAVYSCNTGYFLLGNPSITCHGFGRLSTSEMPSCHPSPPTEYRYCKPTNSIIVSSYNWLNYSSASQLCRLYAGMIISTQSVLDGCADRHLKLPLYAWMGLPASTKASAISFHEYPLSTTMYATCEIPCLPKRYDQMQSTAMPSNISCRYDELGNSKACAAAKGRTSISILSLITNYSVSLEICRFYNGSILSESSFQAGCAWGLTSRDVIAWVGSPDATGELSDTAGKKVDQAAGRYVICEIPVNCSIPTIVNGFANGSEIQYTDRVTYSCQRGYGIVGDATPMCTEHGNLSSVPYCSVVNCSIPTIVNGSVSGSEIQYTDHVTYSCRRGYGIVGDATPMCTEHGNLSSVPYCSDTKCQVPDILNGSNDKAVIVVSFTVTYSCIPGLKVIGDATPRCIGNGTLSSVPRCAPFNCSLPEIINGTGNASLLEYGQAAQYSCNSGYFLLGSSIVTCNGDGTNSPIPSCHSSALTDYTVCNSSVTIISYNKLSYGSAKALCLMYNGTILPDSSFGKGCASQYTKQQQIGWRGLATADSKAFDTANAAHDLNSKLYAICEIHVKCNVPAIANGQANLSVVAVTQSVTYSCPISLVLDGDMNPTCQGNGNLTSVPSCIKFVCTPPVVSFATSNASFVEYLEAAKYSCQSGYFLLGNPIVTCDGYKNMSPKLSCHPFTPTNYRYCGSMTKQSIAMYDPIQVDYHSADQLCRLYNGSIISNESVNAGCTMGLSSTTIQGWSGTPTDTGTAKIVNGVEVPLNQTFPVLCEIPCVSWREASTAGSVQCRYHELTGARPCTASKSIARISIVGLQLDYNTSVAMCSFYKGKVLSQSSFQAGCATGLATQEYVAWSGQYLNGQVMTTEGVLRLFTDKFYVICEIAGDCSVPTIANGVTDRTGVVSGAEPVVFSCDRGFRLVGDARQTCSLGGKLTSVPRCEDDDECMSKPCLNNATCINQVGAFQCRCRAGFTGDRCQSLLDCPAFQRRDSGGIFCEPCACDQLGSESCDMTNGTCYCKPNITGSLCDRCIDDYYQLTGKLSGCAACSCDSARTAVGNTSCDSRTGICNCLPNFSGHQCQYCSLGYFDLSAGCPACSCSAEGSLHAVCDQANNGQCACKPGSSGLDCAQCLPGFFKQNSTSQSCAKSTDGQPCQDCRCSPVGSKSSECSVTSGECSCLPGYTGQRCHECTDAAQYYTEQAGCLNMNESMLTPLADTQVSGDSFSLTYPVVFGSSYAEYSNVTVSRNGFMSLDGSTGGYNRVDRVADSIALVAPLWTNTATASRCNSGTVTSHVVSNSTDSATFSQILQAVRASSIGSEEFTPSEAVVTTWREMRENDTHDRRNTFQAAIIGDECQTFALFFYPKYGVSWLGNPKAVVSAWRPATGNIERYFSPASVARQLVIRLTPGCSQRLRGIKKCRALVETPSYLQSTANLLQCPAEHATASVLGIFERQPAVSGNYLCYRSTPVSNGSRYQASSVCCYGSDGLLVDSGALQAYETYQVTDASILAYCQQGGVLNEFFGKRRSPRATTNRVALSQASGFGDPHLTNFKGEDFDFHGIGEYLMARFATPAAYNFSIFTRHEVAPVNALNFTSITRIAINLWISKLQQNLSVEVFAYSNNTLAIVGDDQLVQSIRAGNHTYFRLHSGSLVMSYGSSSVQVSVQQAPVLFLAFQVAHDPFSTVDGLLNMSRPSVDLSNLASVLAAAATLQVQPDHDVFTYDDATTYATYNPAGVVPNQAVVDVLHISSEANATCNGDFACLADFIATGSTTLATSTLVTKKALQQSSIAVAHSPPLITLSTDVLNANFNVTSNVTVRAAAALTLNISVIEVATSSGIVPGDLVSAYSPQSGLVFSWTPSQRQPSSNIVLRVRAVDSANQASIVTVPITLCSCFGECSAAPAITAVSTPFTLLTCTACLPGQTGRICEGDIDACLSQPCGGLRQCSDEPAPSLGYRCGACASGFRDGGSSNLSCVPMDECAEGVAVCAPTISTCQDQLASYHCPCAVGYTGTGNNSCVDVDECQDAQLNDCDHKYATCTNTRGSYTCGCKRGFQGPGISAHGGCYDMNQCSTGQHDCVPEAECLDDNTIAGQHTCTCPDKQLQSSDRNCDVALTSRVSPDTPATQKFPVGTAITMTCLFTGFARNGISWTLASRSVLKRSSGMFTVVTSVTNTSATSTLSFTIGANNLTGEYSCVGGNSRGSSTQAFLLTVTPDVSVASTTMAPASTAVPRIKDSSTIDIKPTPKANYVSVAPTTMAPENTTMAPANTTVPESTAVPASTAVPRSEDSSTITIKPKAKAKLQSLTLMITNATSLSVESTSTSSAAIASAGAKKKRKSTAAQKSGGNNNSKDRTTSSSSTIVRSSSNSDLDVEVEGLLAVDLRADQSQRAPVPAKTKIQMQSSRADSNRVLQSLTKFEDMSDSDDGSWQFVTPKKPTEKNGVVYVGQASRRMKD
ncbi:sushi, von Willebrand factor type A, EGF and pentraxin domain-containing protein 1-like [Sycon ciliatum]|uniref:sushi, von Willebrand factor type A, EGF and pentraxin domain-containing protein 1-like n=1 Tax=Sycon ciliatum TaxID=27933 RepID=UPI0031F63763